MRGVGVLGDFGVLGFRGWVLGFRGYGPRGVGCRGKSGSNLPPYAFPANPESILSKDDLSKSEQGPIGFRVWGLTGSPKL